MKKEYLVLIALVLTLITRFYKLGEAPAGLYLDEAAQGYNAYSILKTGKDEFGKEFPIVFRSFTDFKTPVYIYLVTPLIPLFGLTEFTVRFPSFFFSVLTIPILYLLVKKLSGDKLLAGLSCILLAISPWHILFGRTNFECNVALFFFLTGILLFYKALENPKFLILSSIFFAIAIPSYHAQRLVTPLMVLALSVKYRETLLQKSHHKYLLIGAFVGLVLLLPTISIAMSPGFLARAGLNIFNFERALPPGNETGLPLVYLATKEFFSLYVSYFSPRNMFVLGDYGPRSSFPDLATFFIWQFPFYIYGVYRLVKSKMRDDFKFFIISFILIAPLPAALTRDPYSTIRSLQMVIPQIIIIGLGILPILKLRTVPVLAVVVFYSLLRLYSSVVVLNEHYRAVDWNYGWKEVVLKLNETDQDLPVVVDIARSEPYSQLLFYLKFDPSKYQEDNPEVPLDEYYTNLTRLDKRKIGRITTKQINWEEDLLTEQYLVGDSLAISDGQIEEHNLTLVSEIQYPDKNTAFRIVKTNP